MTRFAELIKSLAGNTAPDPSSDSTEVNFIWRERLLRLLLLTGSTLGLIVAFPILFILFKEGKIALVVVDLLAIGFMFVLLAFRKLSFVFRAVCASLLLYALGVGVIANMGPFSGGPAFLFCFAVIAGVLLGMRVAIAALVLNIITTFAAAYLLFTGWWPDVDRLVLTTGRWMAAGFSFVFLNAVATISVTFLVRGLETALQRETAAKAELQKRREELEQEVEARGEIQQKLFESQERFRVLSDEVSFDGLFIHDQGTILDVNLPYADMHGYSREEMQGMSLYELTAPGSREPARSRIEEGSEGVTEFMALRRDGSIFPIEVRSREIELYGKKLRAVAVKDISERKAAEQELKAREEWYRTTFEHTGTAMYVTDENADFVMANERFCQMMDLPCDEIVGKIKWHVMVDEDELPKIKEYARLRREGGNAPTEYEFTFKDAKGNRRQFLHHAKLIPGTKLVISSLIDIDERKKMEAALRESEKKFRQIVQSSPMGIGVFELNHEGDLVLLDANPAADRIMGVKHAEKIGMTIEEAFPGVVGTESPRRLREAALYGSPWQAEFFDYNEERLNGCYNVYAFQTAPGTVTVMYLDVTDRKRAEEERDRLEAQLRQAQKMEAIGTLAGGIAHDFNNILSAIMGYGELAQMEAGRGKDNSAPLEHILTAAERARDLVKQILTFSRRSEYDRKLLDLNHLVSHSVKLLGRTLPKMVDIRMNLAGKLPQVRADATMLEQVIMNLAGNASDAMPEGGRLTIETGLVSLDREFSQQHLEIEPGDYVFLSVSDTGQGMDQDTLEHIFDPFFTTKDIGKGTGLGLSTTYGVVKEHEGHILCESELGEGSSFKIYLPAQMEGQTVAEAEAAPPPVDQGGCETLLIVDDEKAIRDLGSELLEAVGYGVMSAASGENALEVYNKAGKKPDLVILDLGMPGMGGHRCLKELLDIEPGLKVLIASGYSAEANVKDLLRDGAAGYIAKPFRRADLLSTVRSVLDG
jgi:two-component system cell cycle sensor histidine kinase/response regulator CckA